MLKTRDGVAEMAVFLRTSVMANLHLTRLIQKAGGDDAWPSIGTGRKDPGVTVRHLLNNYIAVACSPNLPAGAAVRVKEFNQLRYQRSTNRIQTSPPETRNPLSGLSGTELSTEFVERVIYNKDPGPISSLLLPEFFVLLLRHCVLSILGLPALKSEEFPTIRLDLANYTTPMEATVTWPNGNDAVVDHYVVPRSAELPLVLPEERLPYGLQAVFGEVELLRFLRIALKTGQFDDLKVSMPPQGGEEDGIAIPESETAAISPLQGTNAAGPSDQPAQTELDGSSEEPHSAGEREKTQSPSNSWVGRRCNFLRSDADDRYQHAYAGPLAA